MKVSLPLKDMTIEEKLQDMEAIWDDLSQNADELSPPAWHGKVLEALETAIERGEESFGDWEAAKRRIRNSIE
jgi:hypothetical protein